MVCSCSTAGVSSRGEVVKPGEKLLKEHKNNFNSLSKAFKSIEKPPAFLHPRDYSRLTLPEVQRWALSRVPPGVDWTNKTQDKWTAPPCTVGIYRHIMTGEVQGFATCGSWTCERCGAAKKRKLQKKVEAAFGDQPVWFGTLTVSPKFNDRDIGIAFQRLRASLKRYGYFRAPTGKVRLIDSNGHVRRNLQDNPKTIAKQGYDDIYFWTKEFTPESHPYTDMHGNKRQTIGHRRHIHFLTNFNIPKVLVNPITKHRTTLSNLWLRATKNTSNQIKIIGETTKGRLRASYIFKYITKMTGDRDAEKDFQRYERRYGKTIGLFTMKRLSRHMTWLQLLNGASRSWSELVRDGLIDIKDSVRQGHRGLGASSGYGAI